MATDSSAAAVLTDADEVDRRIQQRIGKDLKVGLSLEPSLVTARWRLLNPCEALSFLLPCSSWMARL